MSSSGDKVNNDQSIPPKIVPRRAKKSGVNRPFRPPEDRATLVAAVAGTVVATTNLTTPPKKRERVKARKSVGISSPFKSPGDEISEGKRKNPEDPIAESPVLVPIEKKRARKSLITKERVENKTRDTVESPMPVEKKRARKTVAAEQFAKNQANDIKDWKSSGKAKPKKKKTTGTKKKKIERRVISSRKKPLEESEPEDQPDESQMDPVVPPESDDDCSDEETMDSKVLSNETVEAISNICEATTAEKSRKDDQVMQDLLQKNWQIVRSRCVEIEVPVLFNMKQEQRENAQSRQKTFFYSVSFSQKNTKGHEADVPITKFSFTGQRPSTQNAWVPISRSFLAPDDEDLKFVPTLENDRHENQDVDRSSLLTGFDINRRLRMIKYGSEASQEEVNEKIDLVLQKLQHGDYDLQGLIKVVSEQLDEPYKRVKERYAKLVNADKPVALTESNSYRDLWCSRCQVYDCSRHGFSDTTLEKAENSRFKLMLAQEREGKWASWKGCSRIIDEKELRTSLTKSQETIFDDVFGMFEGDVVKVSQFFGVPTTVTNDFIQEKKVSIAPDQNQSAAVAIKHHEPNSNYYSIHNYNESWYTAYGKPRKRPEFSVCYHEGMCDETNCSCIQNNHFCISACAWGVPENRNFFRGCNCDGMCVRKNCSCFAAGRECDPNLCSCSCSSHPAGECSRRNDNILMDRGVQLGIRKSNIKNAGWGCFNLSPLRKGDFVGEYVGEVISHDEAERRGVIADANNRSYLFNLTEDVIVDSSKFGNKTRFINDSNSPNVEPRIVFVQGEERIGFYAKRDIEKDEELFFNYRYAKSLDSRCES